MFGRKKIKTEIINYLEVNKNKNVEQFLWNTAKVEPRGKFIVEKYYQKKTRQIENK